MTKSVFAFVIISATTSFAGETVTFDTPKIDAHLISANSNLDVVCRALMTEYSAYVPHSLKRSRKVTVNRQGCLSTIAHSVVYQFDNHGIRSEEGIWQAGRRWITSISCWK